MQLNSEILRFAQDDNFIMITKNILKQPKSQVEVQIQVPWADIEPIWNSTLQKMALDVELPGFRKGTAPLNMVENQIAGKVQEEVFKVAMPQFLIEALKGSDIVPIDYPKYQLTTFAKGQGLQYRAMVTNRPEIKVGDYKTIKIAKPTPKTVSDDDVTKVVEDLFRRWKVRQPGTGQQATGNSGQANQTQANGTQGSISFQDSKQSFSESKIATLRQAQGKLPHNDVSESPDDNFAKAMGALGLDDLKTKIRKDLEDQTNYNNELDYEESILQQVEKVTTVDLPEVLIDDELNRMLVSLQRRVADMGMLLDDYLKSQKKTLEQLKAEWKPQAEKNVRMELGLSEIARMEGVLISDDELQAEIDKISDAKVKKQFEAQEPKLQLRHALRQTKTLDLLKKLVAN